MSPYHESNGGGGMSTGEPCGKIAVVNISHWLNVLYKEKKDKTNI
jgi:hypothetical protein